MVWLTHVNSRNRRYAANKPKVLTGLSQTGDVVGTGAEFSLVMDIQHHRRKGRA
jgi:hypothetical protein